MKSSKLVATAIARVLVLLPGLLAWGGSAFADDSREQEDWAIHGQFTNVTQGHGRFNSPYGGGNSLEADSKTEETTDVTLYAGMRVWRHAELWLNPEIDQGFGLSDTLGVAGFPSGEAYKIGASTPYIRLPRVFLRQVIPLGGDQQRLEPASNQLGGMGPSDNVTLTLGKFSVVDVFDANSYAHDPRADFLNWSLIDAGAFDYAADAWGYTYGAAAEWNQGAWTLRGGFFQLSPVPNGKIVRLDLGQRMLVVEGEKRYRLEGRPGKIKLLAFANQAPMGSYREAVRLVQTNSGIPDTASVRRRATRSGYAFNWEQEWADGAGIFARASANDGSKEAYEFTEINQSLSAGASLKGSAWGRSDDSVGLAAVVNRLSPDARIYFAAGGMGILIGDGRLNYGDENVVEGYYSFQINRYASFSIDYQHVDNPAYNRDRGPVNIGGVRLHVQF